MKNIDDHLDFNDIEVLVSQASSLETFSQIEIWDNEAKIVIGKIDSELEKNRTKKKN